jgi:hypothetical protein
MWRDDLEVAFAKALACRGTVMLSAGPYEDGHEWVAVFAAVDGSLQVNCGEPRRRWPWWRRPEGWRRLEELGFTPAVNALQRPVDDVADGVEAAERALLEGHAVPADTRLQLVLVHPGFDPSQPPPAPDAPIDAHIEVALRTLVGARRGKARFDFGRPSLPWAWADVVGDELELERADREDAWRVPLEAGAQREAARELAVGMEPPLFVALMGLEGD